MLQCGVIPTVLLILAGVAQAKLHLVGDVGGEYEFLSLRSLRFSHRKHRPDISAGMTADVGVIVEVQVARGQRVDESAELRGGPPARSQGSGKWVAPLFPGN